MKIAVQGLWHLGCVTAAACASVGHDVVGLCADAAEAARLSTGKAPLHEPGLDQALAAGLASGRLRFSADAAEALRDAEVLWVAFDTPVDEEDRANVSQVTGQVLAVLPLLAPGALLLVSSQLPAGTCKALQAKAPAGLRIACAPENLRLGQALKVFLEPDRVVLGAEDEASRAVLRRLFEPISDRLEWMSVASAEMTKHAVNAFLATSVVFINEIAAVCEKVGADAGEVARGLKTESRIGPLAYLSPGSAFGGGTLARDLRILARVAGDESLFAATLESNHRHLQWPLQALKKALGSLKGKTVALLGLAYKPGTDTWRRSVALELALALQAEGAAVRGADPLVKAWPAEGPAGAFLSADPAQALQGADALVLFHPWPGLEKAYAALGGPPPALIDPMGLFPGGSPQGCPYYLKVGKLEAGPA